jgi:hypothetical protein
MVTQVLTTGGFYFSPELDLSHSLQFLSRCATDAFYRQTMVERVYFFFFGFLSFNH